MNTYISLLRGINVGGKNMIKMSILHEIYNHLGYKNVTTLIQSGNVVFQSEETDAKAMETDISKEIVKITGLNIPVIIRTNFVLKSIIEQTPFENERTETPEKLYFCFLAKDADQVLLKNISGASYLPDKYTVKGDTIYLFCQDGYGNTKLNNVFWEQKLKVKATTRNLKTITALIKISDSM